MLAQTVQTIDELTSICEGAEASVIRVVHAPNHDIAQAIRTLATQAAAPVRVVCCNQATRNHLKDLATEQVEVLSTQDLACQIMASTSAQSFTKRSDRMLDANEIDVLIEDMKVSGMKPKRLREMMRFFYKSLAEGVVEESDWLVARDEQMQYAILDENLISRKAMLPFEASYQALRALRNDESIAQKSIIIAEDFGAMSVSTQLLLSELSTQLIAFGRNGNSKSPQEDYPNAAGFTELAEREDCLNLELASDGSLPNSDTHTYANPSDEFAHVADQVKDQLDAGTPAEEILIAVPNSTWAKYLAARLEERGVSCYFADGASKIAGDPRLPEKCGQIKLAALAKLAQDANDYTATRSYLGAGDWLLRSDCFLELMAWAVDHEMTAAQALQHLAAKPDAEMKSFYKLQEPLDELQHLQDKIAAGTLAAEDLAAADMPLTDAQAELLESGGAEALFASILNIKSNSSEGVCIASFPETHARFAAQLFITGLVNGFLPQLDAIDDAHTIDHKRKAIERDRENFEDIKQSAREAVHLSLFAEDSLKNAELLPMDVARIFVRDGQKMAKINPSEYLQEKE